MLSEMWLNSFFMNQFIERSQLTEDEERKFREMITRTYKQEDGTPYEGSDVQIHRIHFVCNDKWVEFTLRGKEYTYLLPVDGIS